MIATSILTPTRIPTRDSATPARPSAQARTDAQAGAHRVTIGRYLVSTLSRRHDEGRGYRAGVSIRSGRGSASTDRVMYFTDTFDHESDAHHYALEQGMDWVCGARQDTA